MPNEVGQTMQSDIKQLQVDSAAVEKGLAEQQARLQESIAAANEKTKEVADALAGLQRASGQTVAGLDVKMEEIKARVQALQGELEVANHRMEQMGQQVDDLVKRLEALETSLPPGGDEPTSDPGEPPEPAAPTDPKAMLAHGKKLYKSGKLDEARGVLRELVRKEPKKSGITDDAYFQLGETYFKEKNYRSALQEYIKVVEKFGKGKMADDGYYRIGECSLHLGNLDDAEIFFNEIIKNHRKSPLYKAAKKRLDEIKRKKKKK